MKKIATSRTELEAARKKTVKNILKAGFSHIKFELEGQMGRRNIPMNCQDCTNGRQSCSNCQGKGVVESPPDVAFPAPTYTDCNDCNGDGGRVCSTCNGAGQSGSWGDNTACHKFMLNYVLKKRYGMTWAEMREKNPLPNNSWDEQARVRYGMPDLTFGYFYVDGSVDSEYTFTVPIESLDVVPLYLEAFDALCKHMGRKLDVQGAGMHVSVLPKENNGKYPTSFRMPSDKVNNFVSEVGKLLPALFFLGTAGNRTRPLGYRNPVVASGKYSAISTHSGTCYEFRVFDTCYERPEAIFDYAAVIANCLKFHADPTRKVKAIGAKFGFCDGERNIAKYFTTPEQLRILSATMKHLKPEYKSVKTLREERGLHLTIGGLRKAERVRIATLKLEFEKFKKNWEQQNSRPFTEYEKREIKGLMELDGLTQEIAEEYVRANRVGKLRPNMSTFISQNSKARPLNITHTVSC